MIATKNNLQLLLELVKQAGPAISEAISAPGRERGLTPLPTFVNKRNFVPSRN